MVKMQTNAQRAAGYRELQAEFTAAGKTVLAEKAAKRAEGFEVLPPDERPMLSDSATTVLYCCAKSLHPTATRRVRGKDCPVINLDWNAMARAQGFSNDADRGATTATLRALQELRDAGLTAWYDEGSGTFGHTTTVLISQD